MRSLRVSRVLTAMLIDRTGSLLCNAVFPRRRNAAPLMDFNLVFAHEAMIMTTTRGWLNCLKFPFQTALSDQLHEALLLCFNRSLSVVAEEYGPPYRRHRDVVHATSQYPAQPPATSGCGSR